MDLPFPPKQEEKKMYCPPGKRAVTGCSAYAGSKIKAKHRVVFTSLAA